MLYDSHTKSNVQPRRDSPTNNTRQTLLDHFATYFDGVEWSADGASFTALCPAHGDTNNSFSASVGRKGSIVCRCHAGCSNDDVNKAADLR